VLAWREVLHEGPVPVGLSEAALRETRARFVASCGWASYEDALAALEAQERKLSEAGEVVLWFERDLFDQLELVQVLAQLGDRPATLVDLGEPTEQPPELARLDGEPLGLVHRALARHAWTAFRAPDPLALGDLAGAESAVLPYVPDALRRLLEELPAVGDGLSRTERELLEAVAGGAADRPAAFEAFQRREQRPFMGDAVFWLHLDGLVGAPVPLLTENGELALTAAGEDVLAGRADHVRLNGIDRWIGGVHLVGTDADWRWDAARGQLRRAGDP
jgi:hypothetical protein